jgi:hypothetical protein
VYSGEFLILSFRAEGALKKCAPVNFFISVISALVPSEVEGQAGIYLFLQRVKWTPVFAGATRLKLCYELKGYSTSSLSWLCHVTFAGINDE